MEQFSSQDITNFLKLFIEAGGGYIVDDENVIRRESTGEMWCIPNSENPPRNVKLVIYSTTQKDPDVIMVNPFSEGLQTSAELQWFYITKNFVVSSYLRLLYIKIIENCLKVKANEELDSEIVKLISPYLDMVDEKMYDEVKLASEKLHTFCDIYWNANKKVCELKVSVFSENFRKSFAKRVRQKTWAFLTEVAKNVFGTDNPTEVYRMKSDNHGCAKFEAFSQVFLMVFKAYRPYFPLTPDFKIFDLEMMEKHISMIPLYYHRAKNMVSPVLKPKAEIPKHATPPWKPVPVVATVGEYIPPAAPTLPTPVVGVPVGQQQPSHQVNTNPAIPSLPVAHVPVQAMPVAAPTMMAAPVSIGHAVAMQQQMPMGGYGYPGNPMVQQPYPQMHPGVAAMPMGAPLGNPQMMGFQQQQQPQYPPQMGMPMMGGMPMQQGMGMGYPTQQPMQQGMLPQGYPPMGGYPQNMGGYPQQYPPMGQPMYAGAHPQMYPNQGMPMGDVYANTSTGLPVKMSANPDNNRAAYVKG